MIDLRVPVLMLCAGLGASAVAQTPDLSNAWVRAMPPTQRMTAAYLQLSNSGVEAISILGVSSDAGAASLHETRLEDGRSTMRPVESLVIEPGDTIVMAPGAMHIMLMGLQKTPAEGETVPICLQTSGGEVCTQAQVRRAAPDASGGHDHH